MTLATRCSACGTSFRVVQDQLKVSGGWVRCGRCNEVFNAIEGLYEVGSPMAEPAARRSITSAALPETQVAPAAIAAAPPTAPAPAPAPTPTPTPTPAPTPAPPPEPEPEPVPVGAERRSDDTLPAWQDRANDSSAASTADGAEATPSHEPAAAADEAIDSQVPSELVRSTLLPDADDLLVPSPADEWRAGDWPMREPTPSFVVAAERAAQRRRPRSRGAWGAACALLALLLAAQATLAYRDAAAARWPLARAPLETACDWLGCRVEPLRHIAALSVEASGLQQLGTTPVYVLSVTMRNRSDIELMAPALDLVLTDSMGRTIARRVLTLTELGRPSHSLAPGTETSAQATLSTGGQRVSGYTIEIFYP